MTASSGVVITEKGETLVEPTDRTGRCCGLSTSPQLEMYDLAVIGGGARALPLGVRGVRGPQDGDREGHYRRTGGPQFEDRELPGLPTGVSGAELTTSARRQAERFGAEVITTQEAGRLEVNGVGAAHSIRLNEDNSRRACHHPRHRRRLPPTADHRMLDDPSDGVPVASAVLRALISNSNALTRHAGQLMLRR